MNLQTRLSRIDESWQIIEEFLVDVASRFATYITPLIPASFVFAGVLEHFAVTRWLAWITAISIELLGLSVLSNLLAVMEYNRHITSTHHKVRTSWHVVMVGFYISTIGAIVFGLKINPQAFSWVALAALTLLSLIAYLTFLMRRQQHSRAMEYMAYTEKKRRDEEHKRELELEKERIAMEHDRLAAELEMEQMRSDAEHKRQAMKLEAERRSREAEAEARRRELQVNAEARRIDLELELEFRQRESDIDRTLTGQTDRTMTNRPDRQKRMTVLSSIDRTTPGELSAMWGYDDRSARRDLADAGFVKNGDGYYHRISP